MTVGYCPPTLADPWLATTARKLAEYCAELGITLTAIDGGRNIETQIRALENFIAMRTDLIIAQPLNVAAFQNIIGEARRNGVKVLGWANLFPYDVEANYKQIDEVQGRLAGEMAIKWADSAFPNAAPGSIKVAWLTTDMDHRPTARERCEGMRDAVLADPRFTLVFHKDTTTMTAATDAINECLALHRDINVILTFTDGGGIGANAAVMADRSLDRSKIGIFSGSASDEGRRLVEHSVINDSVLRGVVTYGEDDIYFKNALEIITQILDDELPLNSVFFCELGTYNSVGYVTTFDAKEYARNWRLNNP
jgi:ABC-type sugar transport system substrate-binding protein